MPCERVQRPGDLGVARTLAGRGEHVALPVGERTGALGERGGGQPRVDDPLAGPHPAYRVREPGRRCVLDQEGVGARFHGPAQIAGSAEGGEDDDLQRRMPGAQPLLGVESGQPGHLDVQQRHVRLVVRGDRVQYLVASADLDGDLDVRFQPEQRGERLADHRLVLGEQQSDHRLRVLTAPRRTA